MNFDLSEDQKMMQDTFAGFLQQHSSMARVRAAMPSGFDPALWRGLAALGAFSMRVPEAGGGLGLGILDAAVLMEEAGRTLASGPLAETLVAGRLLAVLGGADAVLLKLLNGDSVVSIAFNDIAEQPLQWIAGGLVAESVIARRGKQIVLVDVSPAMRVAEENLASTPIAELRLGDAQSIVLSASPEGLAAFAAGLEEWKLLMAAALNGMAREAIRLASAYACEREAFGKKIGAYQAISHPLADLITEVDGGKYLAWKVIHDMAYPGEDLGARISLTIWWNATAASRAVAHALHAFGGYGLTTEYDIHLYNLRAKAWPLVHGDPSHFLEEAGRRLYAGESVVIPEVGAVSIDFDLGEEAHALARETDEFFEKNLTPELKAKAHYSFDGHDPGIHRKLAQARLLFPGWSPELGGRNALPYAINASRGVWEEHNWTGHATGVSGMVGSILNRFGSAEVKRDILSKIVAGEAICSLGFSEPGAGSDVFAAVTRATPDGDGWRIDGQKMFTSGANLADYVLLLTRTDPNAPKKHQGLTMFIVPLKTDGVEIQAMFTFQDERTNITFYDGVKIPDSYRLGEVGGGVRVMTASLEIEHGGGGFMKYQERMRRAAEALCRDIPYRGRPLIQHTDAQMRLARSKAHTEISDVLCYHALWAGVTKKPNTGLGPMSKLFSSEKFLSDSADLLNLTAPYSLSKRPGPAAYINQCYRHAQGTTIYGGTSEIHRSQIAERALGLPRSRA